MSKLGLAMITVNPVFRNDFSRTFMELGKIGIHDLEFKTFSATAHGIFGGQWMYTACIRWPRMSASAICATLSC